PEHPWIRVRCPMSNWSCFSALTVLPLLVPCHLNGFEFLLVGILRIVAEASKVHNPFVKVGEADGQRVGIRVPVCQRDRDVLSARPGQGLAHSISLTRLSLSFSEMVAFMMISARWCVA